jgi:hypothetical protein
MPPGPSPSGDESRPKRSPNEDETPAAAQEEFRIKPLAEGKIRATRPTERLLDRVVAERSDSA